MHVRINKGDWEQFIYLDRQDPSQIQNTIIKLNKRLLLDKQYLWGFIEKLAPKSKGANFSSVRKSYRGQSIEYIAHSEVEWEHLTSQCREIVKVLLAQVPKGYHFRHIGFCIDKDLDHGNIEIKYSNYHHMVPKNLSPKGEEQFISGLVSKGAVLKPKELVLNFHVKHRANVLDSEALSFIEKSFLNTKNLQLGKNSWNWHTASQWDNYNLTRATTVTLENFASLHYSPNPNSESQNAHQSYRAAEDENATLRCLVRMFR